MVCGCCCGWLVIDCCCGVYGGEERKEGIARASDG